MTGESTAGARIATDNRALLAWLQTSARASELVPSCARYASWRPKRSQWREKVLGNLSSIAPPAYVDYLGWSAAQHAALCCRILPWLGTLVLDYPYYEWLLQTDPEYPGYRDHLLHALRVAQLADQLLANSRRAPDGRLSLGPGPGERPQHWDEPGTRKALLIASLFHDIGYPQAFLARLASQAPTGLLALAPSEPGVSLGRARQLTAGTAVERWLQRAVGGEREWQEVRLGMLLQAFLAGSHGVWGALALLEVSRLLEPTGDAEATCCLEQAALAVLQHDVPEALLRKENGEPDPRTRLRVGLDGDPVGYLLIVADTLQAGGRPRLSAERPSGADKDGWRTVEVGMSLKPPVREVAGDGSGVLALRPERLDRDKLNQDLELRLADSVAVGPVASPDVGAATASGVG